MGFWERVCARREKITGKLFLLGMLPIHHVNVIIYAGNDLNDIWLSARVIYQNLTGICVSSFYRQAYIFTGRRPRP